MGFSSAGAPVRQRIAEEISSRLVFGDQMAQFSAVLSEKLSFESSVHVPSQSRAEVNMEQTKGVKLRWAIWEPFGIRRDAQRQVHFVQIIKILERFLNADHDGLTATTLKGRPEAGGALGVNQGSHPLSRYLTRY